MLIFMTNLVSYRTFRRPLHIPQTCFLVGTFFAVSYSKSALNVVSEFHEALMQDSNHINLGMVHNSMH